MELKIDLANREEISAAIPLLQMLLDATPKTCGGRCNSHPEVLTTSATSTAQILPGMTLSAPEFPHLDGTRIADPATPSFPPVYPNFPCALAPVTDAASVFGNAAPLAPSGAPSSAGAVPLPTVPGAAISAEIPTAPVPPVPTSVPAAAAPSVPAAPSTHAPAVELDSKGLPWDERIHASTKAKISDGTWRMKKQVDSALVTSVEAELRARVAAPRARQGEGAPLTLLPDGTPKDPAATFGWPFRAETPTAPEAPAAPAATPAPSVAADPTTFEQIMPRITAAVTSGSLPATAIGAACAAVGLPSVVALQTNPQYVPNVWAALKQQYPSLT